MAIEYVVGDATYPIGDGNRLIAHVCNNKGGWGRGFVLAVSARWKEPERQYRSRFQTGMFGLGLTQIIEVEPQLFVANMIAQKGYGWEGGKPPIQYDHLRGCLRQVARFARENGCSVHAPRIGCGLAGGTWEVVETIIVAELGAIPVYIYDLPG